MPTADLSEPARVRPGRPAPGRRAAPTLHVRTREVADVGDLLARLPAAGAARTFSWVRHGEGIVGWGVAHRVEVTLGDADAAWAHASHRIAVDDPVRLPGTGAVAFGTFPFSPASRSAGALVVPAVVVGRREGRSWVTTAAVDGAAPAPALPAATTAAPSPGAVRFDAGTLTAAAWQDAVADVVRRIRRGEASKVVMARDVVARTERPVDVRHLLRRLAHDYPSCWTFSVDRMVGATPELLLRREKGLVACRVLAGTIQREADDQRAAATLASSAKDLAEHEFAVASVVRALRPFCSSMHVPEAPYVLELPNVMHLASDVTGSVGAGGGHPSTWQAGRTSGPSSLALAAALHPTAAVCGTPTDVAARILAEEEAMDRSRYAGPVGWLGADGDGEWGIALRSGELDAEDPRSLRLFAGCGIVAASDPASELAETEAKLRPMRAALASD